MSAALAFCLCSCGSGGSKPPYKLDGAAKADLSIPFEEERGVKLVTVHMNGVPMNMIFDTGCSGVSISLHELITLAKNGKIAEEDILGTTYASIADGSIVENGTVNIKEIKIGEGDDKIVLHNIEASVALNLEAPILLGNGVLDNVASFEIDNVGKRINFRRY